MKESSRGAAALGGRLRSGTTTRVLLTGLPGSGKSTLLWAMAVRGHRTVDTDTDGWNRWIRLPGGGPDWVWDEKAVGGLLDAHRTGDLFVAGCRRNQGVLHPRFHHVVLLNAPASVLLDRLAARPAGGYGRRPAERAAVLRQLTTVEPALRATATAAIDTSVPIAEVVPLLERLL